MLRRTAGVWLRHAAWYSPTPQALCAAAVRPLASTCGGSTGGGRGSAQPGLFGIARLQRPDDFVVWSREAVERCV
jgi:hypothetical protein